MLLIFSFFIAPRLNAFTNLGAHVVSLCKRMRSAADKEQVAWTETIEQRRFFYIFSLILQINSRIQH
jgi:hypothetical protein